MSQELSQTTAINEERPALAQELLEQFTTIHAKRISRTTSISSDRKHKSESPTKCLLRKTIKTNADSYRKNFKYLQQKQHRYVNEFATMKNDIHSLKNSNLLSEDNGSILNNIVGPNKEILKRLHKKAKGTRIPKIYNPELRKFKQNMLNLI